MNLQHRIDLLESLGQYMLSEEPGWLAAREKAGYENGWFIAEFIDLATKNIPDTFLQKASIETLAAHYDIPEENNNPLKTGIIMAGNIPLVGFHDFFAVFITGNIALIKPSSRDQILIKHLTEKLIEWEPAAAKFIIFAEMLKGCDAYIATGSNNSSRYFEYYFAKYPNVIRKNRTSVAILTGDETREELESLADDVYRYFGLGCRNVTKVYVPHNYDFVALLDAFRKYAHLEDHHKYKNNYDYNLALHLLNKVYYMTNGTILLIEDPALFSPISQLNYEFYDTRSSVTKRLEDSSDIQSIVGKDAVPFGQAQCPGLMDYADGVDTVQFLLDISSRKTKKD